MYGNKGLSAEEADAPNNLQEIKEAKSQKMSSVDEESQNPKEGAELPKRRRTKVQKHGTGTSVTREDGGEGEKAGDAQNQADGQGTAEEDSGGETESMGTSLTSDPLTPSVVEQMADEKVRALREEIIGV